MKIMIALRNLIEKYSFGVCSAIGEKWGLQSNKIRLYFIYSAFVTMGSWIIIYLIAAFWLNIKSYFRKGSEITL